MQLQTSIGQAQVGNHPPRKIYSITATGEQAFCDLLRQSLTQYSPTAYASPVNLAFLSALPAAEVFALLEQRKGQIQTLLQKLAEGEMNQHAFQMVFQHQRRHFEAELSLTEEVLCHIQTLVSS